jgi:hypothetical protein
MPPFNLLQNHGVSMSRWRNLRRNELIPIQSVLTLVTMVMTLLVGGEEPNQRGKLPWSS